MPQFHLAGSLSVLVIRTAFYLLIIGTLLQNSHLRWYLHQFDTFYALVVTFLLPELEKEQRKIKTFTTRF